MVIILLLVVAVVVSRALLLLLCDLDLEQVVLHGEVVGHLQ